MDLAPADETLHCSPTAASTSNGKRASSAPLDVMPVLEAPPETTVPSQSVSSLGTLEADSIIVIERLAWCGIGTS
jgi:hypothetical protein